MLWMPLISDLTVGITPPVVLPPLDIEWVWYCHCLNPVRIFNLAVLSYSPVWLVRK